MSSCGLAELNLLLQMEDAPQSPLADLLAAHRACIAGVLVDGTRVTMGQHALLTNPGKSIIRVSRSSPAAMGVGLSMNRERESPIQPLVPLPSLESGKAFHR
jgi:hypothetical protein